MTRRKRVREGREKVDKQEGKGLQTASNLIHLV